MDKLDALIHEALSEEDRAIAEATAEQGFFAQSLAQYSGPRGWVSWLVTLAMLVYAGLTFWFGYEFLAAREPLAAIKWGLGALLSVVALGMLKMYLLNVAETDRVIRELRRVELMLARRE